MHTPPPQTPSACKAPVNPTLKLASFPDSQHPITSVFLPPHPSFHYLSFTLLFFVFLSISLSLHLYSLTFSCLLSPFTSPFPCPPMTSCQGPGDSLSCGIPAAVLMTLPPGPDQREKYSYHFSTERTLTPTTPLRNMCVCVCVSMCELACQYVRCAQTLRFDFDRTFKSCRLSSLTFARIKMDFQAVFF